MTEAVPFWGAMIAFALFIAYCIWADLPRRH